MTGLSAQWASLPEFLRAHVELTLTSLAIGIAISLPLGIAAARRPRLERIALGVASVVQTIPALALLALMVPLLGSLGLGFEAIGWPAPPSIGFLPALIALSLYSVLPMLRNTVIGVAGVDASLREAARGVGMSPREILWQVELPLALPTIVAGVRTATVWVVGMATLATPVGAPSLGNPIFAGLQTRNLEAVLVGSLAAAGLALLLDGIIRALEVGLTKRSRIRILGALASLMMIAGLTWGSAGTRPTSTFEVTIGSKAFTEQYILAEILEGLLESDGETAVRSLPSLGSVVAFEALVAGSLDVYVDYSGTIWSTILGRRTDGARRDEVLDAVRASLLEEYGVHVLAALGFENTYRLAMRAEAAESLGIHRISDLRSIASRLTIASDYEFFDRPEWTALERRYGLRFAAERSMDPALMYEAIRAQGVDVISAYSTDGRIAAYDLRVLEDDLGVIPPYDALVLGSKRLVLDAPGRAARLRTLEGALDAETMRRMNARVDLEGKSPEAVAEAWLWEHARLPRSDLGRLP